MTRSDLTGLSQPTFSRGHADSRQGATLVRTPGSPGLLGRAGELALISAALSDARTGRARRLLLTGEPGIGKSALLRSAADEAGGSTVLEATGIEPEADLAFGSLLAVLRPLLGGLDTLPAGQKRALAGALELGRAASDTRFAVGAATLGLIAAAAEQAPLLLLLDDVQWIDQPSLEALAFGCSRLDADAVAVIAAGRPGDSTQRLAGARFEIVTLGPLADDDAIALLDRSFAALDPRVRDRLVAAAHGNPLALLEIPARLTESQRSGSEPVPDELPAGEALASAFAGTAAALPEPTLTALLVLAVGPPDEPRAVAHAMASV